MKEDSKNWKGVWELKRFRNPFGVLDLQDNISFLFTAPIILKIRKYILLPTVCFSFLRFHIIDPRFQRLEKETNYLLNQASITSLSSPTLGTWPGS